MNYHSFNVKYMEKSHKLRALFQNYNRMFIFQAI
jgi:hypothetical protein